MSELSKAHQNLGRATKNLQHFRNACHILIWGFVLTGGIALWAVPSWARAPLFLSLLISILGFAALVRLSRKLENTP